MCILIITLMRLSVCPAYKLPFSVIELGVVLNPQRYRTVFNKIKSI